MKASNTQVMVEAYRLLVQKMMETNRNYPLHLGVTEAGDGEDGRIKSAVGIGTLLEDGLGDTVRVSLTEDPEFEMPVAKDLIKRYETRKTHDTIEPLHFEKPNNQSKIQLSYNPYEYERRESIAVSSIGEHNVPRVIADFSMRENISAANLFAVGYNYSVPLDKWNMTDMACDFIFAGDNQIDFEIPGTLGIIYNADVWELIAKPVRQYPLFIGEQYFECEKKSTEINFVVVTKQILKSEFIKKIKSEQRVVLVFDTINTHAMPELRRLFVTLAEHDIKLPVIIKRNYANISEEDFQLGSSTDVGALLLDGLGDGIWLHQQHCTSPQIVNSTSFGILQATRTRISKTEYISCPSCGRTLFDLQETTSKIRTVTDHLKGIKIGIMGCIVNGPGEMADADYGYVGVGVGKISLYKGKEVVKKNVPSENAVNELIELIKEHGDWVEKN